MYKDHPGTAMVAFFLSGEQAATLAVPDGEPVSNLHVTSIYLGDTSEIQRHRVQARTLVQTLARRTAPFSGALSRLSHFGPDDDGLTAVVLELGEGVAHRFRARLEAEFKAAGIHWDEKFPKYRPHVTLGYWPEDEIPERFSKPGPLDEPIPVTFSEVSMMWDGERTDTSLGAAVAGDNSTVESLVAVQASAIEDRGATLTVTQPLEFHGVNTHNEKAHGKRGPGKPDLPDVDISITRKAKGGRIPAAKPTNKAELEAHDPSKPVKIEFSLHTDDQKAVVLAKVAKVPGFEDMEGMEVDEAEKATKDRLARNLEELFDRSVEVYGMDRTMEHSGWYPKANEAAREWAEEFGFEEDAVFAALAALSPNADWANNVAWARFIAEKVSNEKNVTITKEMVDAYEAAQVVAYKVKLKKFEGGNRPTKPEPPEPSGLTIGARLADLDNAMAAKALRGMGNHEVLMQSLFGNPDTKAGANSDLFISNAISILRDPSIENIDKRLGKEHKVRSFYNNIRDPLDTEFEDVTGDTHHFGAAFGHPWPGNSKYLSSGAKGEENVNVWSANKSGATGATGAYPLLVDATRQAASAINEKYKIDLRPNQVQSVVWEYHRNTWPGKARTEGVRSAIEAVRTDEARGLLSHEQAENLIEEIRVNAPLAAPKDKLLDQMLGSWNPNKRTRKRVV